jgi:hypothetical protein
MSLASEDTAWSNFDVTANGKLNFLFVLSYSLVWVLLIKRKFTSRICELLSPVVQF